MKKLLNIIILLIMFVCIFPVITNATNVNSVKIRVEGISDTIIETEEEYTTLAVTAWDAVKELLDSENIPYVHSFSTFWGVESVYISSINGEAAGNFGGYDGWLYIVNGTMPIEGSANNYYIKNNDEIVFYYGDFAPGTLIPEITVNNNVKAGSQFEVDLKSTYDEYDENWNPTPKTVKIPDVKVAFNGADYITNEEGKVTLEAPITTGSYNLSISKVAGNGLPAIVRETIKINVEEAVLIESLSLSNNNSLVVGSNVCNAVVKNYTTKTIIPKLIFAVYNGTRLEKVIFSKAGDSLVEVGQSKTISVSLALDNINNYTAKVFVFESFESIHPLSVAKTFD